ncbi:MAG: hypothetical protein M1155_00865 [Patescibacteria group bacterium]|nr:hypothetical protein [Patescibacteria group bacterium]
MKFQIKKINTSHKNLMRVCGYKEIFNPHKNNEVSYARSLEASRFYPRFHIYINDIPENGIEVSLHMDMKKPSYEGTTAHSGEYDGELVEREAQRIKNITDKFISENAPRYYTLGFKKEKEGFWKKLLNFLLP